MNLKFFHCLLYISNCPLTFSVSTFSYFSPCAIKITFVCFASFTIVFLCFLAVELTFKNAMRYNAYKEYVWSEADRLLKLFHIEMRKTSEQMRKEALKKHSEEICVVCTGKKFVFEPAEYNCNGGLCKGIRIKRNAIYYMDRANKFHWCKLDYEHLPENVTVGGNVISKSDLVKKKNSHDEVEPWVACDKCGNWVHQICALFNNKQHKKNSPGVDAAEAESPRNSKKKHKKNGRGKMETQARSGQLKDPYYCPMCLLEYENWYPRRARTKRYGTNTIKYIVFTILVVIIVVVIFIRSLFFQCVLCNYTFQTNPNNVY